MTYCVKINDREYKFDEEISILQAAAQAHIKIHFMLQ